MKIIQLTFTNRSLVHKFDTIVPYTLYQFTYTELRELIPGEEDELNVCSVVHRASPQRATAITLKKAERSSFFCIVMSRDLKSEAWWL